MHFNDKISSGFRSFFQIFKINNKKPLNNSSDSVNDPLAQTQSNYYPQKKRKLKFNKPVFAIILVIILACSFLLYSKEKSDKSWKLAEDYYKQGQYQKVAAEIADQKMPTDSTKLNIYGTACMATGQYDKAYLAYEQLTKSGNNLDAKLMMANIRVEQNKRDEAIALYNQIITSNANFVQAYLNLASLYRISGDIIRANEILTQANKLNPGDRSIIQYYLEINTDKKDTSEYKDWESK